MSEKPKYVEKETKRVDVWRYKKYTCKAKILDIKTGKRIVLMNSKDAMAHDIYLGYRTELRLGKRARL